MASFTTITERKRARRRKNAGGKRKAVEGKRSTASYDELFAACGEPGQPAPSQPVQSRSASGRGA